MVRFPVQMPVLLAMICALAVPAQAQDAPASDPPAHVAFVEGSVILERDGTADPAPASMPLLAGDRLRTQGGRAEVLFADGSALHLDAHTILDFLSDEVVRLLRGRIRLAIAGLSRDVSYRVDAPAAWIQINDPGEYRIAVLGESEVELAVLRGAAELVNEAGRSYIRAGERTFARGGAAPSPPYVFNSAAWDSFDRWSEDRRAQRLGASAQYLPPDVRPYAATLDAHGTWQYEQAHGYVWYPRVHVGWRPYHRGRWVSLRPYGWTWVAADPWGWPTHHYGRWGLSAGAWYWIPGRQWGAAWVSWAYAPDYVSWSPLGWNNRPVLQIVNVNVYGGHRYDPWHAWTVVPRRHFNAPYVHVTRVAAVRVDPRVHAAFVVRDRGPEVRYAVGRSQAPIRSAGRYAVPRPGLGTGVVEAGSYAVPRPGSSAGSVDAGRRPEDSRSAAPAQGERRFPAPARGSGGPSAVQGTARERSGAASSGAPARREAQAAVDPGVRVPPRGRSRESGDPASQVTGAERGAPVSSAPAGAVRATPRVRPSGEAGAPGRPATRRTRPAGSPGGTNLPTTRGSRPIDGAGRQEAEISPAPASPSRAPEGPVRAVPRARSAGAPQPGARPQGAGQIIGPAQRQGAGAPVYSRPGSREMDQAPASAPSVEDRRGPGRYRSSPADGTVLERARPRSEAAPRPPAAPRLMPDRRPPVAAPPVAAPARQAPAGPARGAAAPRGAPAGPQPGAAPAGPAPEAGPPRATRGSGERPGERAPSADGAGARRRR